MRDETIPLSLAPSQVLLAVLLQKLGGSYTFTDAETQMLLGDNPSLLFRTSSFSDASDMTVTVVRNDEE